MTEVSNPAKKMKMSRWTSDELWKAPRDDLVEIVLRLQSEAEAHSAKPAKESGLDELREIVEKLRQQVTESARQESLLVQRLAAKEHELQEMMAKNQEIKQSLNPSTTQLQSLLLDPAVNLMFQHMKQELEGARSKLEQAQGELSAWKFTPDSQTGKRLMAKCRMLLQENEELSKAVSTGKIAKLEGDVALEKKLVLEMKKSETDTEEFLAEMDEDMEAMQGTVYLLQQELREAKERLVQLELLATPPSLRPPKSESIPSQPVSVMLDRTSSSSAGALSNASCLNGIVDQSESRPLVTKGGGTDRGCSAGGCLPPPPPPQAVSSSSMSDGEGGASPRTLVQSADSSDSAVGRTRGGGSLNEPRTSSGGSQPAAVAKKGVDLAVDSVDQSGIDQMDVDNSFPRCQADDETDPILRCRAIKMEKGDISEDCGYGTVGSTARLHRSADGYRTAPAHGGDSGSADGLVNGVRLSGAALAVDRTGAASN